MTFKFKKIRISSIQWVLIVLFACVFFVLRWNGIVMPFERDEGEYAYSAWLLTQNISPYEHSFLQKPPLTIFMYVLGYLINPNEVWPIRIIALFFDLGSIILISMLARRDFGRAAGWIAAFFASVMFVFPFLNPYAANTERFMLLPLIGLIVLYRLSRNPQNYIYMLAGVCGASAFLFKPICLPLIVYIGVLWVWRYRKLYKKLFEFIFFFSSAFTLTVGVCLSYFIFNGSFPFLVEEVVTFNKYYASGSQTVGLSYLLIMIAYWAFFFIIMIWGIVFGWRQFKKQIIFYLGCIGVVIPVLMSARFGHYYFILLPFLAILGSLGILVVSGFIPKRQKSLLE